MENVSSPFENCFPCGVYCQGEGNILELVVVYVSLESRI